MSKSWDREKAYNERRAEKLRDELNAAIADKDRERFQELYGKLLSHNYMPAKERKEFYLRFLREGKS